MNSPPRAAPPRSRSPVPETRSETLFQGGKELVIWHNEQRYLLRITANQKLILTR